MAQYDLEGQILDEGYFEALSSSEENKGYGKNRDKVRVLVAVESTYTSDEQKSKHKKQKLVRYLKMKVLEKGNNNLSIKEAGNMLDSQSIVVTDGAQNFKKFPDIIKEHISIQCFNREDTSTVLPWVHTAISNAKRLIQGVYHNVSSRHLQSYLNEFCYKFNRRYYGVDISIEF